MGQIFTTKPLVTIDRPLKSTDILVSTGLSQRSQLAGRAIIDRLSNPHVVFVRYSRKAKKLATEAHAKGKVAERSFYQELASQIHILIGDIEIHQFIAMSAGGGIFIELFCMLQYTPSHVFLQAPDIPVNVPMRCVTHLEIGWDPKDCKIPYNQDNINHLRTLATYATLCQTNTGHAFHEPSLYAFM